MFEHVLIALGTAGIASLGLKPRETMQRNIKETFENTGMVIIKNKKRIEPKIIRKINRNYGTELIIKIPPGLSKEDFEKKVPELRDVTNSIQVIVEKKKHLHLHFIQKDLQIPFNFTEDLIKNGKPLLMPLGKDITGKMFYFDLAEAPHTLVGGATRGGKTNLIRVIINTAHINNTPETLLLDLVDFKGKFLKNYRNSPLVENIIFNIKDMKNFTTKIKKEYKNREDLFDKYDADDLDDIPKDKRPPRRLIIIDEFADLAPDENKSQKTLLGPIVEDLLELSRKSRYVGMHFLVATQRPTTSVIPGNMKTNFVARISFPMRSDIDSQVILDSTTAAKIPRIPGRCVFQHGLEEYILQVPFMRKEDLYIPEIKKEEPENEHEEESEIEI